MEWLMRKIIFFLLLPFLAFADNETDSIGNSGNSLASLEGDPNTIIHNCVNVITGDFVDLETEIEIPGSDSLTLHRFYCSSNDSSETWYRAWRFNHDLCFIRKTKDPLKEKKFRTIAKF
jgi:hypothetical protein